MEVWHELGAVLVKGEGMAEDADGRIGRDEREVPRNESDTTDRIPIDWNLDKE
jgi:hypothetical protein